MNQNKNDLTKEGSVTFWIRIKDNPHFKDKNSNINFMLSKNVGGVNLTILKEKEDLRVEVSNRKFGKTRIIHNIKEYLENDMMVALTWEKETVTLYLNGKIATESLLEKGKGLIKVVLIPEVDSLAKEINITHDEIHTTVNDRHRGVMVPGAPFRILAFHWFEDKILFVSTNVTKHKMHKNIVKFEEVTVDLALNLKSELPAGMISKKMEFDELIQILARSFCLPVQTTETGEPSLLHIENEWDGTIKVKADKKEECLISGSFNSKTNKCNYVWAFSLNRYRQWFNSRENK